MTEKSVDEFGRMVRGDQTASPLPDTEWIHDDPVTHERPEREVDASAEDESGL